MNKYKIPTVQEIKDGLSRNGPLFDVVSLFAGGGGSSTGYRMAGGQVLAINEFIPEAQTTYCANWPETHIFTQDVRELSGQDILSVIGKSVGDLDIMDGSPPCSAFSSLGTKERGWNKTKRYSDSTQKGVENLFFEYIRILRDLKPKVFVAENVSGLAKGKSKGFLNEILRGLRDSDYHVECKCLDAKFLGVPQSRNRLIFVGVRNDIFKEKMRGKLHPRPQSQIIKLREAFEGLIFTEQDKTETDLTRFSTYKLLLAMKPGEQHSERFSLIKASQTGIAPCITATTSCTSSSNPRHWDNRAFTVAELKRVMSLPDDYILTGSYAQQVERIGRMVAPFMMKAVAENIYQEVLKNANT